METHAEQLMFENISKNMSDADEYPAMMNMHTRCISIIANLWGASKGEKAIGSATTGSSEAIHLGGLAMKRRWQEKRKAEGKSTESPNIIMGANAQVALEKFARYFEVEARILPVSEKSNFRLDPELVKENIDENTIGVFVILGSTYTGHYEPVEEISDILDAYQEKTGVDIPIHVDAASGGFVAPFTHAGAGNHGRTKWNFELPRVKSINTSGHKFGLVYAGVGWIVWRDESYLPKHLVFELHYLGGTEESYTLNFSRPGAQIIAQYYNLIHLGFSGYRSVMENCMANARLLSKSLEATGWYTCVSDIHRKEGVHSLEKGEVSVGGEDGETSADYNAGLPVVAFRFSDEFKREFPHIKQENISNLLRAKQYIIPSTYPFSLSSIPSPALHLDPERGSFLEETVLGWVFGYFFKRDLPLLFPYNPFPSHPLEHRTNNHLHPNRLSPPTLNRQDRNPARCSPRKHVLRPSRPLNKRHLRHDSKPHRTFPFPPSPLLLSPTPPLSIFALYAETNKPHRIPTLKTSPS